MSRRMQVAAVAVVIAAGGACSTPGGSDVATLGGSRSSESPRPGASVDPEEAFLRFAECMREHGVDVGDPQVSGDTGTIEIGPGEDIAPGELREADAACRHLLPRGREEGPNLSPEELARVRDRMLRFAQCMRDQGIDFPDPQEQDGEIVFAPDGDVNLEDPEVQEAQEACDRFLPGDISGEEP